MTILTHESHSVPIVTTMIWYRVGSRHEQPGNTGVSHFLEHMMFKGTKRFGKGEIDSITARHGGFNNAFTSFDYTAYYFSFASDRWETAIEIEADRMFNNVFDPLEFELEKKVILEEVRMELDQPWEILRKEVASASFKEHPYRFPVVGIIDDLAGLTVATVRDRYDQFYLPNNATLVIAGDFDTQKALNQIQLEFGGFSPGSIPEEDTPTEKSFPQRTILEVNHPTTIPRLIVGLPAPSIKDEEFYAFHLLDKLLTEGKLSRLFQRLIEKDKLASMVTSEICETLDPFLLFIRVDAKKQSSLGAVESAVLEELSRLVHESPTSEELARAKKQCVTHYLNDLETTSDQAFNIGLYETLNRLEILTHYAERIESVTSADLASAASLFLNPDRGVTAFMRP